MMFCFGALLLSSMRTTVALDDDGATAVQWLAPSGGCPSSQPPSGAAPGRLARQGAAPGHGVRGRRDRAQARAAQVKVLDVVSLKPIPQQCC